MNNEIMPGPPDRFHLKCRQEHYKEAHRRAGTDWIIQTVETYNAFPDLFDEGMSHDIAHMVSESHARRIVASWNALLDARLEDLEQYGLLAHPFVQALVGAATQAVEALWNVPEVGEGYDDQHAGTHLRAVSRLSDALVPFQVLKHQGDHA